MNAHLPLTFRADAYRRFRVAFAALLAMLCLAAPATVRANCWAAAGARYDIDPLLLYSIAKVESSLNPAAFNRNRNGTFDIGLMQINSSHLPQLRKVGITRKQLVAQPCTSVMAGAQILAGLIGQHGYTWKAVGAYNAGSMPERAPLRRTYEAKVWRMYRVVLQQHGRLAADDGEAPATARFLAVAVVGAGAVAEAASATTIEPATVARTALPPLASLRLAQAAAPTPEVSLTAFVKDVLTQVGAAVDELLQFNTNTNTNTPDADQRGTTET